MISREDVGKEGKSKVLLTFRVTLMAFPSISLVITFLLFTPFFIFVRPLREYFGSKGLMSADQVWPTVATLTPESVDSVLDASTRTALTNVQPGSDTAVPTPTVHTAFATDGDRLGVKFWVRESTVLAASRQEGGTPEVWTDSCVEFFCSHGGLGPGEYLNFEISCIGILLTHFGVKGDRSSQGDDVQESVWRQSSLGTAAIDEPRQAPDEWTLTAILPKAALKVGPDHKLSDPELKLLCNAYKCGDKLPNPHWISLHPVQTESPDFHRPDSFQPLRFEHS